MNIARDPPNVPENFWDLLALEVWMSREYTKQVAYVLLYNGSVDPWIDYFVREGINKLSRRAS